MSGATLWEASWILYSLEDQERNREGVGGVNYVFYKEETFFLLPSVLPERAEQPIYMTANIIELTVKLVSCLKGQRQVALQLGVRVGTLSDPLRESLVTKQKSH